MKFKFVFIIAFVYFSGTTFSQQKISLSFIPLFKGEEIIEGRYYKLNEKDSLTITVLKFYVSAIELVRGQKIWKEKNSYHLIDLSAPASLKLELNSPLNNFSELRFSLGIDSVANVSGAMGGALDPVNGMYWTWQSGYINFKLEGSSNLCKSRKNEFQYHLGGYQSPFNCLKEIKLATTEKEIKIVLDLDKIIGITDLKEYDHIMSPSKVAVLMAEKAATNFHTQQ